MRHGTSRGIARRTRVASAESAHPSSTNTASRSNFMFSLLTAEHFNNPRQSRARCDRARQADAPSSAPLRTRIETVSSSEPRSLGKSIEIPRGSFSAETSERNCSCIFFRRGYRSVRNASNSALARDGAEPEPFAIAPNFRLVENSCDCDVIAHRNFLKRVERGHQLTGAKPQRPRNVEHRGARRRIHREPSIEMARREPSLGGELANLRVGIVSIHVEFREAPI